MTTPRTVPSKFLHDGAFFLAPHLSLSIIGEEGKIRLEAGSIQKEVEYDKAEELIEFRRTRFQTAHVSTVLLQNVDFHRVSAQTIDRLLEGCETGKFELEIERDEYTDEAFALVQKLENRGKIILKMHDFCLAPEQLLSMKPAWHIKATGKFDSRIDDETALALIGREHEILDIDNAFHKPEAIRDAFKLVSSNEEEEKVVVMNLSDELFNQFINLIGVRMVDDELVMENDTKGFTVAND
ncbi:hypothetical protein PMAYCL1PPCAC_17074, partial [Pristionchus mayeri]